MSNEGYTLGGNQTQQLANDAANLAASRTPNQPKTGSEAKVDVDLNRIQIGGYQQPASNSEFSWADDILDYGVSMVNSSEAVAKLEMALPDLLKKTSSTMKEIRILGIDNATETNWQFSAALVAVNFKKEKSVAYMPLLIESTSKAPLVEVQARIENSDQSVAILPTASLAMDIAYQQRMQQEIDKAWPGEGNRILYVPGMILPKDFDFENIEAVKRVIFTAVKSCTTQMAELSPQFVDTNLSCYNSKNIKLRLDVTGANTPDRVDAVGNPYRSDIRLTLTDTIRPQGESGSSQMRQAHTLNGGGAAEVTIGSLGCYIDSRLLPPDPASRFGNAADPYARTRRFVPEVVITNVDLPRVSSLATLMLMVTQATILAAPRVRESLMYQVQRNGYVQYKDAPWNPRDIGWLDMIANTLNEATPGGRDLESTTTSPREFLDYIQAVYTPFTAISIDVPRMGPQSAFMSTLTSIANGEALGCRFLQRSLDRLTGGLFSRMYFDIKPGSTQATPDLTTQDVFSEWNNTVYTGSFPQNIGGKNVSTDIRHIDLTAVQARFGKQDPTMVTKLAQSFMMGFTDSAVRMANKRDVINAYTGDSAQYFDVADRHTFNYRFLSTIIACNAANKFEPVLQYTDPLAGSSIGLHEPKFMRTGLFSDAVANSFSAGVQQTTQYGGGYFNPVVGRFNA